MKKRRLAQYVVVAKGRRIFWLASNEIIFTSAKAELGIAYPNEGKRKMRSLVYTTVA